MFFSSKINSFTSLDAAFENKNLVLRAVAYFPVFEVHTKSVLCWKAAIQGSWRQKSLVSASLGREQLASAKIKQNLSDLSASQSTEEIAIIIVDHGSKREASNRQLEQFACMYRKLHPEFIVIAAHMEIAKPSIADAMEQCAQAGCSTIVVAPYFLSQGRHIQQDIPALVEEAQGKYPNITCSIADPIGIDEAVVGIIRNRVEAALQR